MKRRALLPTTPLPVFADMDELDMCALKTAIGQEFPTVGLVEVRVGRRWIKATIAPSPALASFPFGQIKDNSRNRTTADSTMKLATAESLC